MRTELGGWQIGVDAAGPVKIVKQEGIEIDGSKREKKDQEMK